jgi:hypothetical protein
MSGWKLTSLFGSILNWGLLQTALQIIDFDIADVSYLMVLGDDIDISTNWYIDLQQLEAAY